ncbi:hypothetical protein [Pseudomonas aeruginosa]|uniref:hypothetical protein n=1 Tax=Pseudomonas aeruginosa TaxID=287 RepID=UPI000FEFD8B3|nr:hypothetical protein [Pseudomonas aeruginosa]RWX85880.1 hypothetical protein EQH81_12905 [Pseudomonas aeruginosa]
MASKNNSDPYCLENLVEEAKAQLKQEKLGLETLLLLRWSLGYWELIKEKMGDDGYDSINGLESECSFVPYRGEHKKLPEKELSEIRVEVERYFLIHDKIIRDLLGGISNLASD